MTPDPAVTSSRSYAIRFARPDDMVDLRRFISSYWKASHVLSESGELLRWSHLDERRQRLNFALAHAGDELVGILGFIPTSHFDPAIPYARDIWLAMWKVRDDVRLPGLGTSLLRFLQNELSPQSIFVVGNNEKVALIYKLLGFELVDLQHYYRMHPDKTSFTLISGDLQRLPGAARANIRAEDAGEKLEEFRNVIEGIGYQPFKTVEYIRNRYLRHPYYSYRLTGIWTGDVPKSLVVSRMAEHREAKALRIVDLFGADQDLDCLGRSIDSLLRETQAEYADFYGAGFEREALEASGLVLKTDNSVVPNFFEPFLPANVPIHCSVLQALKQPFRIVRADADQDRPSLLPYSE